MNRALLVLAVLASSAFAQDPMPAEEGLEGAFPTRKHYSPYAGRNFPTHVYWGDTHLHTAMSMDAGAFGARLAPEDAYRFARLDRPAGAALPSARLPRRCRPLRQHGILPAALRR